MQVLAFNNMLVTLRKCNLQRKRCKCKDLKIHTSSQTHTHAHTFTHTHTQPNTYIHTHTHIIIDKVKVALKNIFSVISFDVKLGLILFFTKIEFYIRS